jgi:Tol biopolymer transport system component
VYQSDLFVGAAGQMQSNVTSTETVSESAPAWSPDGGRIAFDMSVNGRSGIGVLDVPSGAESFVAEGFYSSPAWSPKGRRLVVTGPGRIEVMNADGSDRHALMLFLGGQQPDEASWSPDGTHIAFSVAPPQRGSGIFVMKSDGTGLHQLTHGEDSQPAWSPKGGQLVFVRHVYRSALYGRIDGGNQLYVIPTKGRSRARPLVRIEP